MNRTDIPRPFYAAAGAGELAYERLRRLPEVAARTADELRARFAAPEREPTVVDLARLRESAQRGRAAVAARAATLQDRAAAGYQRLVARGERLVADRAGMTDGPAGPAGIEVEVGPVQPAERRSAKPATSATAGAGKSATGKSTSGKPAGSAVNSGATGA